jgi:drug/metabolite transporter (DMT)-like permease
VTDPAPAALGTAPGRPDASTPTGSPSPSARPLLVWSALGIVYVVWGSTYLAIKVSIESLPPLSSGAVRFLVAGGVLVAVVAATSPSSLRVTRPQAGTAALAGVLLLLGGNGMVILAERGISSGLAALLVASTPLWIVVLRALTGDRPAVLTVLGVCVGFVGVGLVLLPGRGAGGGHVGSAVLVVAAALSWAVGSLLSTRRPMPANPFVGSAVEMLAGGAALAVIAVGRGELSGFHLGSVSGRSWAALAYLIVFGSLIAFSAYVWVLGNAPVSTVSTYAYVNPVIAVVLGGLVLGERIGGSALVGGGVIVLAVTVVVTAEGRLRRRADR